MATRTGRARGVLIIVLVAALTLPACGGGDDAGDEDAAAGPAEAEDAAAGQDEEDDTGADEDDTDLLVEDDFSDPGSGFDTVSDEVNSIAYEDGRLHFDLLGNASTSLPFDGPPPGSGSITVTIEGDLSPGYAGICLGGDRGQYEFAIASDGYASLGYYTETAGDYGEFDLVDEASEAYPTTGPHVVRARWRSDGGATDLAVDVDGETIVATTDDDRVTEFTFASLCATVAEAAGDGARLVVTYDDLTATGDG